MEIQHWPREWHWITLLYENVLHYSKLSNKAISAQGNQIFVYNTKTHTQDTCRGHVLLTTDTNVALLMSTGESKKSLLEPSLKRKITQSLPNFFVMQAPVNVDVGNHSTRKYCALPTLKYRESECWRNLPVRVLWRRLANVGHFVPFFDFGWKIKAQLLVQYSCWTLP